MFFCLAGFPLQVDGKGWFWGGRESLLELVSWAGEGAGEGESLEALVCVWARQVTSERLLGAVSDLEGAGLCPQGSGHPESSHQRWGDGFWVIPQWSSAGGSPAGGLKRRLFREDGAGQCRGRVVLGARPVAVRLEKGDPRGALEGVVLETWWRIGPVGDGGRPSVDVVSAGPGLPGLALVEAAPRRCGPAS